MGEPLFVTWPDGDEDAKRIAMESASRALEKFEPQLRATGHEIALGSSVTVRDSYQRHDQDWRRLHDQTLTLRPKEAIRRCMESYDEFGIIRNAIDLMSDFGCQGIDLAHPVEEIERFYKEWLRRVNGVERSERFLNMFYRSAHVFAHRLTGKLPVKDVDDYKRAVAGHGGKATADAGNATADAVPSLTPPVSPAPREIPAGYIFLNPLSIEVEGDAFTTFLDPADWNYYVWVNAGFWSDFRETRIFPMSNPFSFPFPNVNDSKRIPLDRSKLAVFYYKRDDWNAWAKPLIYPLLADLTILRKLRMADYAALDSAVSYIRLWKLGDIKNRILPTEAGIAKLANMLATNIGGGGMDLVWGPELTLEETSTNAAAYLGEAKYVPTLAAIREGLGLPTPQVGHGNNYMNAKLLLERLQYGRSVLKAFWENEVRLVQKAMNFKKPATIMFERMVLSDEAAEKALLIQLYDRSGISLEAIQERFGECPEIEMVRLRREAKRRKQGKIPPQAGPWFNPQQDEKYKEIFAQQGLLAPGELDVKLQPKPKGQKSMLEMNQEAAKKAADQKKLSGQPQQGRPKNKKDSKKRKKKKIVPRTARLLVWARQAQGKLRELLAPAFLAACGKSDFRKVSEAESKKFEDVVWAALNQVQAGADVTPELAGEILSREMPVAEACEKLLVATLAELREPTLEQVRQAQAAVVALWKASEDDDGDGESGTPVTPGDNPDGPPALSRAVAGPGAD